MASNGFYMQDPSLPNNLPTTELVNNNAVQPLVVSSWVSAPAGGIAPTVLGLDRVAPTETIDDDFNFGGGNVETAGDCDPASEGIDFYESLEGMLVQIDSPDMDNDETTTAL